jgi:hypothetical protein
MEHIFEGRKKTQKYSLIKCSKCPLAEQVSLSEDEQNVKVICSHNTYELPIETMNEIAEQCGLFRSNFEVVMERPLKHKV